MGIHIGGKYKLVRHPQQPIGTAKQWNSNKEILIEWDSGTLIPPSEWYSEDMFTNGTFVEIKNGHGMYGYTGDYGHDFDAGCSHDWVDYTGLRFSYQFCKKCDLKRL